jgi:hypothetical protein
MPKKAWLVLSALLLSAHYLAPKQAGAEDLASQVKKAVEKSTLDEPGTHPFHLKATYAPSFDRDKDSHRTGGVEIWWQSPTRWRREVRSPEFHQIAIVDGTTQWQKNEGDYFPDWLRELAEAIVRPVPMPMDVLSEHLRNAEVRRFAGQTSLNWEPLAGPETEQQDAQSNSKGYLALMDKTGLLLFTGGLSYGGLYHDFKDYHGRVIARTVASGSPEVTAKLSLLEDLVDPPNGFFDTNVPGGDEHPIETAVLSEADLRKDILSGKPLAWPPLADGPLEGVVWTEVVLDRTGKIREMSQPVADNPGVKDAAEQGFRAMQFQPILRNGIPVQAMGRLSASFKTVRPAGVETFDSARNYFERGRKASSIGAGAHSPYRLQGEFQTAIAGQIETGRYEDTWISETEWKREAWIGASHLARSQIGEKHYVLSEGPESGLLRLVMTIVEPIPAADTMTESDWRIRRDTVEGTQAIRVFRGPEGPNGELEPGKSQGYWFDENGYLLKSYTMGFEIKPLASETYDGVEVARRIDLLKEGKLGLRFTVKEIGPTDTASAKTFLLKGHEWQRAFTAEVR